MTSSTHPDSAGATDNGPNQLRDDAPEHDEGQSQSAPGEVDASSEPEGPADVATADGTGAGHAAASRPATVNPDGQPDGVGTGQIHRPGTDVSRLTTARKRLKLVGAVGWWFIGIMVASIVAVGYWGELYRWVALLPLLATVVTCIVAVVKIRLSQANAKAYLETITKHHKEIKQHHGEVKKHHGTVQEHQGKIEGHLKEITKLRKRMTKYHTDVVQHHTAVGDHHDEVKRHVDEVRRHHQEIEKHNRAVGMHREYIFANNVRSDLRTGLTELLAVLEGIRDRVKTERATTESQRTDLSQAITDFRRPVRDVDELKQRLESWETTANVLAQATHELQEALDAMLQRSLRGGTDVRDFLVDWDGTVNQFANRVKSQL